MQTDSSSTSPQQTYYYAVASQTFFAGEPIEEVLKERHRNYQEQAKAIDFWLVPEPSFLQAPALQSVCNTCPQPAVAIISTNKQFITWIKLRLEHVLVGEFTAPSDQIPDPLASLASVS
jgi:Protein of unknown function (DUF2488)